MSGLIAVRFIGVADLSEGGAREALLEGGGDVAGAAEVVARPAGGIGIPREAGVDESLGVAGGGGAVGDVHDGGVADILEIHERGDGIFREDKEQRFCAEAVGAGGDAIAEGERGRGRTADDAGGRGEVGVSLRGAGALGGEPVEVAVVAGHGGGGAGVAAVVILALDAEGGGFEGLVGQRDKSAAVVVVAGRDEIFLVLAQRGDAEGELLRDEDHADVGDGALGAVAIGAEREFIAIARKVGAGGGALGGAGGTAEAELDGVGTAHEGEALGVVGVGLDGGAEIIAGAVDVAEAAGVAGVVGAVARAGAGIAVAVDVVEIGLGGGGKEKRFVRCGCAEVVEEFFGEDLHLTGDIAEVDFAAATLEEGGGLVTALGVGADLERGEDNGFGLELGGCG